MENKKTRIRLHPLYDRIILKPLFVEKSSGGLLISQEVQQKMLTRAQIVVVGPGKLYAETNEFIQTQVKIGEIVYINAFLGMRIKPDRNFEYITEINGREVVLDSSVEYHVQKEDELIAREEILDEQ